MTRKTSESATAVARTLSGRKRNVDPQRRAQSPRRLALKRAAIMCFLAIDVLCIGVFVWTNPDHRSLFLVLPVCSMMSGWKYLQNTGGAWRSKSK